MYVGSDMNLDEDKTKKIMQIYIDQIIDPMKTAMLRNKLLLYKHGELPSYCAWDEQSVQKETKTERLRWFLDYKEVIIKMYENENTD